MINPVLQRLAQLSQTDLPLMLMDDVTEAIKTIWAASGRRNVIEYLGEEINLYELASYAQEKKYDGILLRQVERLDDARQARLAHIMKKLRTGEKGKFILTTNDFDIVNRELLEIVCKVKVDSHSLLQENDPLGDSWLQIGTDQK